MTHHFIFLDVWGEGEIHQSVWRRWTHLSLPHSSRHLERHLRCHIFSCSLISLHFPTCEEKRLFFFFLNWEGKKVFVPSHPNASVLFLRRLAVCLANSWPGWLRCLWWRPGFDALSFVFDASHYERHMSTESCGLLLWTLSGYLLRCWLSENLSNLCLWLVLGFWNEPTQKEGY